MGLASSRSIRKAVLPGPASYRCRSASNQAAREGPVRFGLAGEALGEVRGWVERLLTPVSS